MILLNRFAILDFFAGQAWLLVLTSILISVLLYLLLFKKLFSLLLPAKNFLNKMQSALLLFIVIPAVLAAPLFSTFGAKYGRSTSPPGFIAHDRQYIYVLSDRFRTGRTTYTNFRLHKIEMTTGNETERYLLERNLNKYSYALVGSIFWVEVPHKNKLTGVDINNGDKNIIDEEYLQSIDTASNRTGIQKFTVDFSKPAVQVFRKDGSEVFVNPFTEKNAAVINFQTGVRSQMYDEFRFTDETRAKLTRGNEVVLPDKSWIFGRILTYDSTDNRLIIVGYKTTEKESAVIECYSSDLLKMWEISAEELPAGEVGECFPTGGPLLLFVGTSLVSIDPLTGKLNWEKRM